jgi:RNA polymerase sigma factor (sigma-70 family)
VTADNHPSPLKDIVLDAVAGRDQFAGFADFFARLCAPVVRSLAYLGFTLSEAEDAAQEAFAAAYRYWDAISYPVAYVHKAARTIASTHRGKAARVSLVESLPNLVPDQPLAEANLVEAQSDIMRALLHLPAAQATTIALIMDGFTAGEIGEFLYVKEATVRSNLRHARRKLEALLAEDRV